MKYNLQFFADGEEQPTTDELFDRIGAEDPEPAEQEETVNEAETEQAEEPQGSENATSDDGIDKNAIYAAARRRAEADLKRRQAEEDARFAERFKGLTNPETHKPITTTAEYFEALDAQERMRTKAELESKGVDYSMIETLINNSPRLREADRLIREMQAEKANSQIANDVAELSKLNPAIKSLEDVPPEVVDYTIKHGISLVDSYKIANYGNVTAQQTAAIKQGVINQVSGKAHLSPVNGVVNNDNLVDIPADQMATWKTWYPDLSEAELRKKYNRVINH